MADLCKQCSIDTWGTDSRDLAIGDDRPDMKPDDVFAVMCDGCSLPDSWGTVVNADGECIVDCTRHHGTRNDVIAQIGALSPGP